MVATTTSTPVVPLNASFVFVKILRTLDRSDFLVRVYCAGNVAAFRGIPYAAPPVGTLRWRPPQPVRPWKPAVLNASTYGSKCVQPSGNGTEVAEALQALQALACA